MQIIEVYHNQIYQDCKVKVIWHLNLVMITQITENNKKELKLLNQSQDMFY